MSYISISCLESKQALTYMKNLLLLYSKIFRGTGQIQGLLYKHHFDTLGSGLCHSIFQIFKMYQEYHFKCLNLILSDWTPHTESWTVKDKGWRAGGGQLLSKGFEIIWWQMVNFWTMLEFMGFFWGKALKSVTTE